MEKNTFLSNSIKEKLSVTVRWSKLAAVLTLIGLGIEFFQMGIAVFNGNQNFVSAILKFLLTSVFSLVIAINLYQYSKHARHYLQIMDAKFLLQAFRHLKTSFMIMGISLIILSTLFLLSFIVMILHKM